jgi:hypothetical protein
MTMKTVVTSCSWDTSTFQSNRLPPYSESKCKSSKKLAKQVASWGCRLILLVSWLGYSSTLNMEGICSSETSVDFYRTMRHYILPGRTLLTQGYMSECGYIGFIFATKTSFASPDLTWDRTRATAVGSRRLTAWAMGRPLRINCSPASHHEHV